MNTLENALAPSAAPVAAVRPLARRARRKAGRARLARPLARGLLATAAALALQGAWAALPDPMLERPTPPSGTGTVTLNMDGNSCGKLWILKGDLSDQDKWQRTDTNVVVQDGKAYDCSGNPALIIEQDGITLFLLETKFDISVDDQDGVAFAAYGDTVKGWDLTIDGKEAPGSSGITAINNIPDYPASGHFAFDDNPTDPPKSATDANATLSLGNSTIEAAKNTAFGIITQTTTFDATLAGTTVSGGTALASVGGTATYLIAPGKDSEGKDRLSVITATGMVGAPPNGKLTTADGGSIDTAVTPTTDDGWALLATGGVLEVRVTGGSTINGPVSDTKGQNGSADKGASNYDENTKLILKLSENSTWDATAGKGVDSACSTCTLASTLSELTIDSTSKIKVDLTKFPSDGSVTPITVSGAVEGPLNIELTGDNLEAAIDHPIITSKSGPIDPKNVKLALLKNGAATTREVSQKYHLEISGNSVVLRAGPPPTASATPIPTLGEMGTALLALLMTAGAALGLRRKRR